MKLLVVTPSRLLVDAEVSEVTAPGAAGEFGVLAEHVTFLGELDVGLLSYVEDGRTRSLVIDGGYGEVRDDVVTILADRAEYGEEIDPEAARAELAEAERELEAGSEDPAAIESLLRALKRAETRVAALQ